MTASLSPAVSASNGSVNIVRRGQLHRARHIFRDPQRHSRRLDHHTRRARQRITLTIAGAGNQTTTVALSVTTDPNLNLTGLTSPVFVDPGQTVTEFLTLTPGVNAALDTPLVVTISGAFGSGQTSSVQIPVTLEAQQAVIAVTDATPRAPPRARSRSSRTP